MVSEFLKVGYTTCKLLSIFPDCYQLSTTMIRNRIQLPVHLKIKSSQSKL